MKWEAAGKGPTRKALNGSAVKRPGTVYDRQGAETRPGNWELQQMASL
jgi:hypothetical protein